ncbi:hypothetical protein B4102_1337 [Heyndrickxia sporothermodurans]|uniref:Uncharacterized protein n=1 Tax=Heyndrickxia sporothermodurans TaxID=46224 RepID=A0A150KM38_9BACI|nr:hypothetical protein [Heyndrickxia sporothermodurans]KYC95066.1 hypothetical protein B4102_1337 [Heyndrickxia sporothermodurans]
MKKKYAIVIGIFIVILFLIIKTAKHPVQETITFFPLHKNAQFIDAETMLTLIPNKQNKSKYKIEYEIYSKLDRKAYLRQDIGLLFKNGRLIKPIGIKKWQQHSSKLTLNDTVNERDSGYYEAISFHYGEIQEKGMISSVQRMSFDKLYVIDSKFTPNLLSFHSAATKEEKQWEDTFNQMNKKQLDQLWIQAISKLGINRSQYHTIPLSSLPNYNDRPLPGFTKNKSQEIIGKLWEGLYKNYLLGIKKEDGTSESLIGSTVPLLLFNKNNKELLIIFITKSQEPYLLKQIIN